MKLKKALNIVGVNEEKNLDIKIFYSINLDVGSEEAKMKAKGEGVLKVLSKDSYSIVSTMDAINYLIDNEIMSEKEKDSAEILKQILYSVFKDRNLKFVQLNDSLILRLDYGTSLDDSVGFMLVKRFGSPSFSKVMRLNGKALPNKFDISSIDSQILYFSTVGGTE